MKNIIGGIIAILWGGGVVLVAYMGGGPQGTGAYAAGSMMGIICGAMLFVIGIVGLIMGVIQVNREQFGPKKKKRKRRRREDDDY